MKRLLVLLVLVSPTIAACPKTPKDLPRQQTVTVGEHCSSPLAHGTTADGRAVECKQDFYGQYRWYLPNPR